MRRTTVAALVLAILPAAPLAAATFVVTNTNNSGTGSLRWAIEQANAQPGPHQIRLNDSSHSVTYRPVTELPRIERDTEVGGGTLIAGLNTIIEGSQMTGSGYAGLRLGDNVTVSGIIVSGFRDGEGGAAGIRMEGTGSQITRVYVGSDAAGTGPNGNDTGVVITGSGNTLGYDFEDARRQVVVSGNGVGIAVLSGTGNVVQQTWIGLGATRAPLPNTSHGIVVAGGTGTRLGRPDDPAMRPLVAFNGGDGLRVTGDATLASGPEPAALFYENGGAAIDLGGDGPTPNDPGDGDDGPNELQNFPVLTSAAWSGVAATANGTLSSRPNETYAVDFFAARVADAGGRGQAGRYLGRVDVTTDASGQAAFGAVLYGAFAGAPVLSATATDVQGNVSELSPGQVPTGTAPAAPAVVVNATDDADAGWCSGAHCNLRAAITASSLNLAPENGRNGIHFGIPGPGPHSIAAGLFLPTATEPVLIDGYTQPGSSPNTQPVGHGLDTVIKVTFLFNPNSSGGLDVVHDSIVRGLAFNRFPLGSALALVDRNAVEGCFIGLDANGVSDPGNLIGVIAFGSDNRIGGTTPAARNLISGSYTGVELHPASSNLDPPTAGANLVQGNLIGTTADGHAAHPNTFVGVDVSASNGKIALYNVIGGTETAARNVISGNDCPTQATFCRGIDLFASSGFVMGTLIQGNFIGTDVEGDDPLPNEGGITLDFPDVHDNLVGGSEAGAPNVISGNSSTGVGIGFGSVGNRIERNLIGLNAAGTAVLGNGDEGIFIDGSYNVVRANTIRGSGTYGISVVDGAFNQFWRNSISGSTLLGLDLGFDGVTGNDPLDADDGPNGLQNFPVLSSVAPGTTVSGSMPGAPNRDLMFEFFASPAAHPTGSGEGQRFIGSRTVTTDATGNASFTFTLGGAVAGGEVVSATATDIFGNTSEFSAARTVVEPAFRGTALAVDAAGNGVLDPGEAGVVSPSWKNSSGAAAALTGTVTALTGPPGPQYTRVDASASYGTVGNGAQASCTATGDCYRMQVSLPAGRPQVHLDAVMDEQLSSGTTRSWTLHVGGSFADVIPASPFYRFVETLLHRGITAGCGGANYCNGAPTSRQEMAVFVLGALEGTGYRPLPCGAGLENFPDMPASSPYCRWVQELVRRHVVGGCGNGLYCPTDPVTREQMAVFVLATREGSGYRPPACVAGSEVFSDVPASSGFCPWVEELARRGVVAGCGGGRYCGSAPVTREQMSVFLAVTFGLTLYP